MKTKKFGIKSIRYQTVLNWNILQNEFKGIDLTSAEKLINSQQVLLLNNVFKKIAKRKKQ